MVSFNFGLLLAFDVLRARPDLEHPFGDLLPHKTGRRDGWIILSNPRGHDIEAKRAEYVSAGLPQLFGEQLKEAFVRVSARGTYFNRWCVLTLSQYQVVKIIEAGHEGRGELKAAVEFFLPKLAESVWPVYLDRQFGSLLVLSAGGELPSADDASPEVVSDMLRLLGQDHTAAIPFSLFELLVFPAPWPRIPDDFTVFVTRAGAIVESGESVGLPLSAFELARYISKTIIVRDLAGRLKGLPLGRMSVSEYLGHLGPSPGRALTSYQQVYLQDREKTLQELLETQLVLDELSERSQNNYVEVARRDLLSRSFTSSVSHPLKFRLFNRLVDDSRKSIEEYQAVKQLVEAREQAARDFLRDLVVAEATASNLVIQKRIRILTMAAVLVGILGVGSNLLPDNVVQALFDRLFGWAEIIIL